MKSSEQCFPVVLFVVLYKVILILSLWVKFKSEHSNKCYRAVLPCGTASFALKDGFNL